MNNRCLNEVPRLTGKHNSRLTDVMLGKKNDGMLIKTMHALSLCERLHAGKYMI